MERIWIFKSLKYILLTVMIWLLAVYSLYNLNSLYVQIAEIHNKNLLIHLKSEWLRFSIISALFISSSIYTIVKIADFKFQARFGKGITIQSKNVIQLKNQNAKIVESNQTEVIEKPSRNVSL